MKPKTLEDIEAIERETLTCEDISGVLGAKKELLHDQALRCPERLGFPVICYGRRVLVPKRPFLKFMKEGIA